MQQTLCLDLLQCLLDLSEAIREVASYVKEKYGLLPVLKCQVTNHMDLAASEERSMMCSFPHGVLYPLQGLVSNARYSWSSVYSSSHIPYTTYFSISGCSKVLRYELRNKGLTDITSYKMEHGKYYFCFLLFHLLPFRKTMKQRNL